ncbi:HEAT repeat domain-containing protein, partial [Streptomyces sp. NRRL S-495]|uniref:HEAT repeat domain-containing protein n=1 Tax=Streptomyces sp. NRRL S-495 TaxID=1609133 RepID=UPI0005F8AABF
LEAVLDWFRLLRRRRGPIAELAHLAAHPDYRVRESLVWAIGDWRTPGVAELLAGLADDPAPDVREAVARARGFVRPGTADPEP